MRKLLVALAIALLPSVAIAAHGGGGGGGHGGGGGGGSMGAARGGAMVGQMGARGGGPMVGHMGPRVATSNMSGNWGKNGSHHRHHRHARFFFAGGPWFASYNYYGYDCWRWAPTPWGPRPVWVCDYF